MKQISLSLIFFFILLKVNKTLSVVKGRLAVQSHLVTVSIIYRHSNSLDNSLNFANKRKKNALKGH